MFTIYTNSSLSYVVNTHFFGQHKVCYEFFAEYLIIDVIFKALEKQCIPLHALTS